MSKGEIKTVGYLLLLFILGISDRKIYQ